MSMLAMSFLCAAQVVLPMNELDTIDSLRSPKVVIMEPLSLFAGPKEPSIESFELGVLADEQTPPFGTRGSWRWNVGAGGAVDVKTSRNRLVQGGVGVSYFIMRDLSLNSEFNVIYFSQIGDDAVGANLNLSFRHHLIATDTWSLYGEGGAGILGTTEPVPDQGSRFNFVPHAGVGMSFDVGSNRRLMTGVR